MNQNSTFTPGPWHVAQDLDLYGNYRIEESAAEQEDWVNEGFEHADEEGERRQLIVNDRSEMNRLLIEVSPEMFEVCRLLAQREDDDDPLIQDARAILDKIETAQQALEVGGGP